MEVPQNGWFLVEILMDDLGDHHYLDWWISGILMEF